MQRMSSHQTAAVQRGVLAVPLFWRIFALNAVVLAAATALLLWAPVTVSVPVVFTEALVLLGGFAVMLVANAVLLHVGLAPLDRLTRRMATVDLLKPGQRLPVAGHGGVPALDRCLQRHAGDGWRQNVPPAVPVRCLPRRRSGDGSPRNCTTKSARA